MNAPDFRTMCTGRLRAAVASLAPHVEWSPVGLLGGLLCAFSAMLPDTRVQRGSGSMPLMLHVLLCGGTGEGKGQSWNVASAVAKDANRSFMTGHVINGVVGGAGLIQAVADRDGHALIVDTEYARVLRAGRRQANLSQVLRDLWDGAAVATSRAKEPVQVDDPRVSIMGHITPEEFRASMSATERDGGSYNRLLILPVAQVRWLSEREQMPVHLIPEAGEAVARAVRFGQRAGLVALADDAYDTADIIRRDLLTKARESEGLKAFAARCNEQVRRIAALFALFDLRSQITAADLQAAAALVTYAMESVEQIAGGTEASKGKRQPLSLLEKVRARIDMHGGRATSSQVLPFVNATAAEVKALPGITVRTERLGNGGRPAIVFALTPDDSPHDTSRPAEQAVVETAAAPDTQPELLERPRLRLVPSSAPAPKKRSTGPALDDNPFLALL
ncbi:DUF3987 domain-containing protein [Streptomyces sp. ET3-23]|uniref:DUF3987 domain-containing protein n=1 Tax=Streptomyces sp. ET3-23 TaxID=2885643 RepID=UPI001D0F65F7|nr:DUF3987 domain-containing protein [Streptomyces sp. ET3-23]MCC2278503.1 DUF3987 domain-containing protein [Streptomyces sp. ET3-23]